VQPLLADHLGFYHWGSETPRSIQEGTQAVSDLGGKIIRIALSPAYPSDYRGASGSCLTGFSLTQLAQLPDIQRAFDNPQITTWMLTAYDGTSLGDCVHHRYLTPGFYTPAARRQLVDEYRDFTLYLYERYHDTGKQFLISNWESDNDVYCGSAWLYTLNQDFREACDFNYPNWYGGNQGPRDSLEGLKLWFQARYEGIQKGRERARKLKLRGIKVWFAPEILSVHLLANAGFPSVLYDILPQVTMDAVSYSSYESISQTDPTALPRDLDTIRDTTGAQSLILGEFGFPRSDGQETQTVARIDRVISEALAWGVEFLFDWNLYDQNDTDSFGMFDGQGTMTALGHYYQTCFASESVPP
jgi:hypothetical protein